MTIVVVMTVTMQHACGINIRIEVIDSQSSFAAASERRVPTSPRRVFPRRGSPSFISSPASSNQVRMCGVVALYRHPHRYLHTTLSRRSRQQSALCTHCPPDYTSIHQLALGGIYQKDSRSETRTMPPIESYRGESNRIEPNRTES